MGLNNSKTNASDSNTDSKSDEPGVDDESENSDSWPSTSDPGKEDLADPTTCLPSYVGGAADRLATQPDATTKTDAPRCADTQNDLP